MTSVNDTLKSLQDYFDSKIKAHGATPLGVDWNGQAAQFARFEQLLKVIPDKSAPFTLLDYGCGYGALAEYLHAHGYNATYVGYDMTVSVIEAARQAYAHLPNASFTHDGTSLQRTDYVIGSGLFNMKMNAQEDAWRAHMHDTLRAMWALAGKGMAFNSLTSYSDPEYMRADLYYPNPMDVFDFCKRELSRNVALLHDYTLYDFTVLVRRIEA
jgi:SAM-dependent methyltransferase